MLITITSLHTRTEKRLYLASGECPHCADFQNVIITESRFLSTQLSKQEFPKCPLLKVWMFTVLKKTNKKKKLHKPMFRLTLIWKIAKFLKTMSCTPHSHTRHSNWLMVPYTGSCVTLYESCLNIYVVLNIFHCDQKIHIQLSVNLYSSEQILGHLQIKSMFFNYACRPNSK